MRSRRIKRIIPALWDAASWSLLVPGAVFLRYDYKPPQIVVGWGLALGICCAAMYIFFAWALHLYRGRYIIGSFDEVAGIISVSVVVAVAGSIAILLIPPSEFPRTSIIIATGLSDASMLGARFLWRGLQRRAALRRHGKRTLVYGAGDAGCQIVNLMLNDKNSEFQPVGFVDDDPKKEHLRRAGIKVLGTIDSLEQFVMDFGIEVLLIAISGIPLNRLLELDGRCAALQVRMRIIPTASEIAGGAVKLGDISDVTEEDLMGRRQVVTDEEQITTFVRGRRVLVTGAGGSIGSELARQLYRYKPASLVLLDRDESALHALQLTLDGSGTLTSESLALADIRDSKRLQQIFREYMPEIVFHAAALKHLPLLERSPAEAFKTNIVGTWNVLQASKDIGVSAFVNISTDKAADPSSALGFSKLVTERLTASISPTEGQKYVSVRFGNVLGSRGSVLDTFRFQISRGGPVTVTDREVTRYFMTVREAVHLVLQASVLGGGGETLVLDMGSPVRILDIAQYMIERSGRDIAIEITGLRQGEKRHESLVATTEQAERPLHPLISHIRVPPLSPHFFDVAAETEVSVQTLRQIAFSA